MMENLSLKFNIYYTIKDLTFDNIYHEHFNYWCLIAILNFFENSSMKVYKVKEVIPMEVL